MWCLKRKQCDVLTRMWCFTIMVNFTRVFNFFFFFFLMVNALFAKFFMSLWINVIDSDSLTQFLVNIKYHHFFYCFLVLLFNFVFSVWNHFCNSHLRCYNYKSSRLFIVEWIQCRIVWYVYLFGDRVLFFCEILILPSPANVSFGWLFPRCARNLFSFLYLLVRWKINLILYLYDILQCIQLIANIPVGPHLC